MIHGMDSIFNFEMIEQMTTLIINTSPADTGQVDEKKTRWIDSPAGLRFVKYVAIVIFLIGLIGLSRLFLFVLFFLLPELAFILLPRIILCQNQESGIRKQNRSRPPTGEGATRNQKTGIRSKIGLRIFKQAFHGR